MTATMMAGARPKPPDHPVVLKADRMVDVDERVRSSSRASSSSKASTSATCRPSASPTTPR